MLLSFFPQILFLAPAGTTLLRVAAAICFLYMAWDYMKREHEISGTPMIIIGHMQTWMVQLSATITAIVGVFLLVGAWTQIVAIFSALICLKGLIFYGRYHGLLTYQRSTYWLLLCISLMLVVTGAGAFAFDLPL